MASSSTMSEARTASSASTSKGGNRSATTIQPAFPATGHLLPHPARGHLPAGRLVFAAFAATRQQLLGRAAEQQPAQRAVSQGPEALAPDGADVLGGGGLSQLPPP